MLNIKPREFVGTLHIISEVDPVLNRTVREKLESLPPIFPELRETLLRVNNTHYELIKAVNRSTKTVLENP